MKIMCIQTILIWLIELMGPEAVGFTIGSFIAWFCYWSLNYLDYEHEVGVK